MPLRRVSKGTLPAAADINAIVDEVNRLGKVTAGRGIGHRNTQSGQEFYLIGDGDNYFWAMIDHCSADCDTPDCCGTNPGDNTYCVVSVRCKNTDTDDPCKEVLFEEFATDHPDYKKVVATNLAEAISNGGHNTHQLSPGTIVQVFITDDDGDPTTTRYWFTPGGTGIKTALLSIGGAGSRPASYEVTPYYPPVGDIDLTGTDPFTFIELGDISGPDIQPIGINVLEINESTNYIASGSLGVGFLWKTNSDGTDIYVFWGIVGTTCHG